MPKEVPVHHVNNFITMPNPEFAQPSLEPQRRRPELRIVPPPPPEEQEVEPGQIVEEREMTPLEMAKTRVEQLRAELAEAERQVAIEEAREIVGREGGTVEQEWFGKEVKEEELN